MLTIVTALPWEAQRFVARLRGQRRSAVGEGWAVRGERNGAEVRVVVSGPGRARVERAATALTTMEPAVTGLLAVGVCGGLTERLRVGELVVALQLRHQPSQGAPRAGPPLRPDERLAAFAIDALERSRRRWQRGDTVTVDAPILSRSGKQELGALTAGVIAQMEDYYWAQCAAEMGVPFASVRCVLDPVQRSLPEAVGRWDWRGPRAGEVVRGIVRAPTMIPALIRLARERRRAAHAIDRFLEELVRRAQGEA